MPKEIAHWVIADRVRHGLPLGRLADAVRKHPNCLHLGAVFHDVGYYGQGQRAPELEAFADQLHGARGEDTNQILRLLAPALEQIDERPCLAAFAVGLVTHIVADRQLHPLVYYFTGNYYEADPEKRTRAVTAHRRLEALMDLRLTGGLAGAKRFSLRRILGRLEVPVADLVRDVAAQLDGSDLQVSAAAILQALGFFAKVQWLARRPSLVKLLGLPLRVKPEDRSALFSLTYFTELEEYVELLEPPLSYRNPYSGERRQEALDGAIESVVENCLTFCAELPGSLADRAPGSSLEMGLRAAATAKARHFHPYVLAQDYAKVNTFQMLTSSS